MQHSRPKNCDSKRYLRNTMNKEPKTRKITDGVELLDRKYVRKDEKLKKMVEEEFEKLQIGQQIYDLRKEANLTQEELAEMVGTTGSVISRLENADYDGHSVKMLQRVASALGKKVTINIVDRDDKLHSV
jgi:DNA-directed RNA polymerase specialized sigma subunit